MRRKVTYQNAKNKSMLKKESRRKKYKKKLNRKRKNKMTILTTKKNRKNKRNNKNYKLKKKKILSKTCSPKKIDASFKDLNLMINRKKIGLKNLTKKRKSLNSKNDLLL